MCQIALKSPRGEDDRVYFQVYSLSLTFQVWIYDAIHDIRNELSLCLNTAFHTC